MTAVSNTEEVSCEIKIKQFITESTRFFGMTVDKLNVRLVRNHLLYKLH